MLKTVTLDQNSEVKSEPQLHISEKDDNGLLEICMTQGKKQISLFLEDSEIRDVLETLVRFL